jgi:dephospho-CoA kinase
MGHWIKPGGWIIGVTGGIACGKSEVGKLLADAGIDVRDSDQIAHAVMARDGAAYRGVVEYFGDSLVKPDGEIDRAILGARVFADPEERAVLNALVHPHVRKIWQEWAASVRRRNAVGAILIPLLYEVGADRDMDVVICVAASTETVMERLQSRKLSANEARQRINSQMPLSEKMKRADYIIENNESLQRLADQAQAVLASLQEKENITYAG